MEILIKIAQFILSFSLLVLIHELGHFMFARLFGVRVEKFYLFFNPWFSLFKKKIGQTEYGIGWLPLGGYVKIAGMIDESMDTDQMKSPPKPDEFRSKPAWQRLLIMSGGVIMNVLLAIMIYIGISWQWGERYIATEDVSYGYVFSDLAQEIGFRNGDRIISVDGKTVEDYFMLYPQIVLSNTPEIVVERDGQRQTITIDRAYTARMLEDPDFMQPRVPFVIAAVSEGSGAEKAGLAPRDSLIGLNGQPVVFYDQYREQLSSHAGSPVTLTVARDSAGQKIVRELDVDVSGEGTLGVYATSYVSLLPISSKEYSLARAVPVGVKRTGTEINNYWKQVKMIFSPKTEAYKSLGGVLAIGSIFPEKWSWEVFWRITAFLSLVLAVMNLLPIPGLDGGHIMFLLYELVARRKPSDRFMEFAQLTGMAFLLVLIIYANGNDIYRFFIK